MRIAIGGDHPAFELKEVVKKHLEKRGIEVVDVGTHSTASVDYPKFGAEVGMRVANGDVDRGIVICGTGVGISIAANKIPGVRAGFCHNTDYARLTREHNDANVLALGARFTAAPYACDIVDVWLETPFAGGRHAPRVEQISELEAQFKGQE